MKTTLAVVALLAVLTCMAVGAQAAEYPIKYVTENAATLANKVVTVRGAVANSQAVTPTPLSDIKGEYDLTDKSGTVHVRTADNPPPNGTARSIKAVVDNTGEVPVLNETGGPPPPWLLIVVLAVLVALAVVLVVLLVRKPSRPVEGVAGPQLEPSGPPLVPPTVAPPGAPSTRAPVAAKQCPKCGTQYGPDDNFCDRCPKQPLEPVKPATSRTPTVVPTGQVTRAGEIETREVSAVPDQQPLADLTVIEGPGAGRGTQFKLSKAKQTIGRAEGVQIRLPGDDTISRPHAAIGWDDGTFYIADLDSKAGTLVNGQRVHRQALSDGDTILLGKTKLRFRLISQGKPGGE